MNFEVSKEIENQIDRANDQALKARVDRYDAEQREKESWKPFVYKALDMLAFDKIKTIGEYGIVLEENGYSLGVQFEYEEGESRKKRFEIKIFKKVYEKKFLSLTYKYKTVVKMWGAHEWGGFGEEDDYNLYTLEWKMNVPTEDMERLFQDMLAKIRDVALAKAEQDTLKAAEVKLIRLNDFS